MTKRLFVIVPAAVNESPVKGAAALANAISKTLPVTFVELKPSKVNFDLLNENIERLRLYEAGSWLKRLQMLKTILSQNGDKEEIVTLSICLSADILNSFCQKETLICTSVRGNLELVYPQAYGKLGKYLALIHLHLLRRFDIVISMTQAMAGQIEGYIKKESPIIGNFIDEDKLNGFRREVSNRGDFKFVYVGSLTVGKRVEALITAVGLLRDRGVAAKLDLYGDGPLMQKLKQQRHDLNLVETVTFKGFMDQPYSGLASADVFVLPSLTEGVSRAALEALYLGIPCVMRNIDGNSELITPDQNGDLFSQDEELAGSMLRTAKNSRSKDFYQQVLIPSKFRQQTAAKMYLDLFKKLELRQR